MEIEIHSSDIKNYHNLLFKEFNENRKSHSK